MLGCLGFLPLIMLISEYTLYVMHSHKTEQASFWMKWIQCNATAACIVAEYSVCLSHCHLQNYNTALTNLILIHNGNKLLYYRKILAQSETQKKIKVKSTSSWILGCTWRSLQGSVRTSTTSALKPNLVSTPGSPMWRLGQRVSTGDQV